ncbi:MAG: ACP S-malonyltransferase [Planctomycetota bacterium]
MSLAAIIFPGQGSQSVGMGRDIFEASPRAREVFERSNRILGFDLAKTCFDGPAEKLEQTDIQQPAIFVTSIALWEAFLEAGGSRDQFAKTGGLSLGEYTALHVAGALEFEEALRLVHRRGQLMQEAADAVESGMVSLVGANEASAKALCDQCRGEEVLFPANLNCPGQVVISGHKTACARAMSLADEYQCRAVALKVAGAFHSPLMESAALRLAPLLERASFSNPAIPVISNVDAEYHDEPASIPQKLYLQVTHPVYWQKCVERMVADGVTEFVEMGPGRVLSGLVRKIHRPATVINVSTAVALASAIPA